MALLICLNRGFHACFSFHTENKQFAPVKIFVICQDSVAKMYFVGLRLRHFLADLRSQSQNRENFMSQKILALKYLNLEKFFFYFLAGLLLRPKVFFVSICMILFDFPGIN